MQSDHRTKRLASIRWAVLSPAIIALFGLDVACASAADVTWDSSGTSPAAPVAGAGAWDLSTQHWSNGTSDLIWSNGGTDTAQFGYPGVSTPTIAIDTAVYAEGLSFAGGSYFFTTGDNSSYGFDLGTTGTIQLSNSAQVTVSGLFYETLATISGSGTFVSSGGNDNDASGFVVDSGVTLVCDKDYNTGHVIGGNNLLINSGGLVQLIETGSAGQVSGQFFSGADITIASGGMLDTNADSETATSLTISGAGISNGGVLVNSAASTTSTLTFTNLYLEGNTSIGGAGNLVIAAPISGSYTVTVTGSGTKTFSGTNTYSGGTNISGGTLSISSDANLGKASGSLTLNGGTLDLTAGITSSRNLIVGTSGGTIDTGSFGSTISGEVSGGNLTVIDNGSLTLSGTVDNSGLGVRVNNGATVVLAKASGAHAHTIGGGGLVINSGGTAQLGGTGSNQIYGSGLITVNNGGVFDLNGQNQDNSGMSGSMYLGGTGINNGGALINSAASTTSTYTMYPDTMGNGAIFLTANSSIGGAGNLVINGAITDPYPVPYAITKVGNGTLTLAGSNTYTGGTIVGTGADMPTLILSGKSAFPVATALTVNTGATVQIAAYAGNPSNVAVTTLSTLTNNGKIDITDNAMIVRGSSTLSDVSTEVLAGLAGGNGVTSSNVSGNALTTVGVIQAASAGTLDGATVDAGDIEVKYTYYGDANLDGKVDGSDYSRIDNAYLQNQSDPGSYTGWFNGDFNYDGVIDGSDFTLIDNDFNSQGAALSAIIAGAPAVTTNEIAGLGEASQAVPEPATASLIGLGSLGLLGRRRRRQFHPRSNRLILSVSRRE